MHCDRWFAWSTGPVALLQSDITNRQSISSRGVQTYVGRVKIPPFFRAPIGRYLSSLSCGGVQARRWKRNFAPRGKIARRSFAARVSCVGGIDLRNIIVVLASFSGFFLAYFGLSGRSSFAHAKLEAKTCIGVRLRSLCAILKRRRIRVSNGHGGTFDFPEKT
jgi:hypothetical protein